MFKKRTPQFVVHYEVHFGPQRDPRETVAETREFYNSIFQFEFDDYKIASYFADQLIKNNRAVLEYDPTATLRPVASFSCLAVRSFEHAIPSGWIIVSRDIWIDNK